MIDIELCIYWNKYMSTLPLTTHHWWVSSELWYRTIGPVFAPVLKLVSTNLGVICL